MTTATPRTPGGARRAGSGPAQAANRWDFLTRSTAASQNPWNPLWAMMIGFFMIMVDSTIVAIANPTIMASLRIGYDTVVWVTSAYLLGYAVVLLVAGRLGDRFGPKNLYLIGLVVFTVSSVWCGLAGSAAMLIAARVVQGVGAGLLTPQTLSTITRIFPAQRRGVAVSLWGATAGAASLVGPLAGGVLVDGLGWQWIFFVNVPIGVLGLGLAYWLIPVLPTQSHRFDLIGVALSGVGIFLIVFGLQQGQAAHWQPWIWALIVAGVGFMTAFAFWQSLNAHEPLIPLVIFGDRDFSLCNVGVAIISFTATAMMLPLTFYAQAVCGLSPTRSALLIAPMAIANGVFAPFVGKIVDKYHPQPVLGFGFSVLAIALTWLTFEMSPTTPIWRLVLPFFAMGVGMAFVWSPLTATATRNLPPQLAGAGSAVYNSVRQLGAVLGSAGMAAFMTWRITAEMPRQPSGGAAGEDALTLQLPGFLREPFAAAMSQSVLLPAFVALFGIIAALFLVGFAPRAGKGDGMAGDGPLASDGDDIVDDDYDDDEYVEFVLVREPDAERGRNLEPPRQRLDRPRPAPTAAPRRGPTDPWQTVLDEPAAQGQPIGHAHNGSHVDSGKRLRQVAVRRPPKSIPPGDRLTRPPRRHHNGSAGRHFTEGESLRGQHHRSDPDDDPTGSGRHSSTG
ncbi:MFS transporter [Mycobacterium sp. 852002-40037_SCH5390672]|uniref:MFS transporter n=1 Tax=Mycobacterium sp. 852002-40037_SCH5390672 TaxID=1834089 RepID=UPI0008056CBB|nr:MFS transporter [Mycobacterium sp. 852002-40037_SCH5390672]OBB90797.1 MFS transporter [Mycobacterium sp. 852002-40037_SCH5390672]